MPIDELLTLEVDAGASLELTALSFDDRQIINRDARGEPIIVGVGDEPFDGQFIQMDVLAVERLP